MIGIPRLGLERDGTLSVFSCVLRGEVSRLFVFFPDHLLVDLPDAGLGDFVHDHESVRNGPLRDDSLGYKLLHEIAEIVFGYGLTVASFQDYQGRRPFAPFFIRNAENRDLGNGLMLTEQAFQLQR